MTLSEIASKYGTDKVLNPKDGTGNNYTEHYARMFDPIREQPLKLLEIGVMFGASIQMWLEYFPNAVVVGVDNEPKNIWSGVGNNPSHRYKFVLGDQSDPNFWGQFIADYPIEWDIVVDDGGHFGHQVITSFDCLWPKVKAGGFYAIEDLACSYSHVYQPIGTRTPMDLLKAKLDTMHTVGNHIDSITFARQLAIVRKRT